MSQKPSIVNFLIRDANGQPQMVKIVQNSNTTKSIVPIKLKSNPVKIYKLPTTAEGNINTQNPPVFCPIKVTAGIKCASKFVQVPVDTFTRLQKVEPKIEPPEVELQENYQDQNTEYRILQWVPKLVPILPKPEFAEKFSPEKFSPKKITPKKFSPKKLSLERLSPKKLSLEKLSPEKITTKPCDLSPTMSHASRRRRDSDNDPPAEYTTKRRKHADKVGKGLRHFSMKVCEKVRNKGFTSYNEVADELVLEFTTGVHGSADSQQYDQKNIRRRVYDALNVLMAMNIISKEKKEIRWLGLPTNSVQECAALEKEKQTKIELIQKKFQQLQELTLQHISFKSLIERNKETEKKGVKPSPSSAIHLPFIVVNTSDKALIDCSISNDKTEYMFNFNKRFQIHDDIDILKRMGLLFGLDKGECSEEELKKVKNMVPKSLELYVEQMGRAESCNLSNILDEEDIDDGENEDETLDVAEVKDEQDDDDGNEYSDDSSDVDV